MNRTITRTCIAVMLALLAVSPAIAQVTFTDVTSSAGIQMNFLSRWSTNQAWGDFNNDGYLDVYVTSWGQASTGEGRNALFQNNQSGSFANVTNSTGVGLYQNSVSAVWGDMDNDGDLDLFVANFYEADVVFRNMLIESGTATFTDVTSSMSLISESVGRSRNAAWGDYNNDGYLDIYIAKYWGKNTLYRNNGGTSFTLIDGDFSDVHDSEAATWVDFDDDGDLDLYVVNREQENNLFVNTDGTLAAADFSLGLNDTQFGRNAVWIDFDNNNRLDLFLSNIGANTLYQQSAGRTFAEVSATANTLSAPAAWDTWCTAFGDYDCDGDFDLFYTGGFDETAPNADSDGTEGSMLMENFGFTYVDRTDGSGILRGSLSGSSSVGSFASSAAFADYDNDGDPDLFITNTLENILYRNDNSTLNYLKVGIDDQRAGNNRNGIGAKIRVFNTIAPTAPVAIHEIGSGPQPLHGLFGLVQGNVYNVEITFLKSGSPLEATTKIIANVTVPLDTVITIQ